MSKLALDEPGEYMKSMTTKVAPMLFALLLFTAGVSAQVKEVSPAAKAPQTQAQTAAEFRKEFVKASAEYESSSQKLVATYQDDLVKMTEQNARLKGLYTDGLISRRDMEASDAAVLAARAKVDEARRQIEQAKVAQAAALQGTVADVAGALPGGAHVWTTGNKNVDNLINHYGGKYGVDPYLIYCVMHQESRFGSGATSNKGAMGLMQLMPGTAARYGVTRPYDVAQNIMGGTRYLKDLLGMFGGRVDLVLAGYNAGEGAVMKYGNRVPPYAETQAYVRTISYRYGQKLHTVQPILKTIEAAPAKETKAKTPVTVVSAEQPAAASGSDRQGQ